MAEPQGLDQAIRLIAADLKQQWLSGRRTLLESYLPRHPEIAQAEEPLLDLIYHEMRLRELVGEHVAVADYLHRFPQFRDQLETLFEVHSAMASAFPESTLAFDLDASRPAFPQRVNWPGSSQPLAVFDESLDRRVVHGASGESGRERLGAVFYCHRAAGAADSRRDFQLLREAATGGLATVYQALARAPRRTIAVKVLLSGPILGTNAWSALQARVLPLCELNHPHLGAVYGCGELAGLPYVSMEFAECGNLADRLQFGPFEPRQAAKLAGVLVSGLSALHDRGLVHGNMKPNNVLLAADGFWKLSDMSWPLAAPDVLNLACMVQHPAARTPLFELARELRRQIHHAPHLVALRTTLGWRLGDVRYLSPELASPDYQGPAPAEDVYGLGVILYEVLSGRPPFCGDSSPEIWSQVLAEPAAADRLAKAAAPAALQEICLQSLAKRPTDRPGLRELADVLAACG